jgi:soluble lytic murein transglycosylase
MSHYRNKEYQKAFSVWRELVLNGGERYANAAVKRLAILAGTSMKQVTLDLLEDTASTRGDNAGKRALFYLSKKLDGEKGGTFLEQLARSYPLSDEAAELFWDRGWQAWKEGDPQAALDFWVRGFAEERIPSREAQLLYWSGRALESLGRNEEAEAHFRDLLASYPESYYSRLAFPGHEEPLVPDIPVGLAGEPDPLETWGFVHYARIRYLSEATPDAFWRAARLASWMGDDRSAYLYASSVSDRLEEGSGLPVPLMELLYPRPYRQRVTELGARFGVEELLVWSVMRQESGFDPQALSWVGAAGLMQLMPATAGDEARKLGGAVKDLSNPDENLLLGVSHLAGLLRRFPRLDWAVAAYNAGSGSVKRWTAEREMVSPEEWVEDIPYSETRDYVKKVLGNLYVYRQIYRNQQEVSN